MNIESYSEFTNIYSNISSLIKVKINQYLQEYVELNLLDSPLTHLKENIFYSRLKDISFAIQNGYNVSEENIEDLIQSPSSVLYQKAYQAIIDKQLLKKYKKENSVMTTQYVCSKCKTSKGTISQMQTRSADEPMTTFYTCATCEKTTRIS